MQSRRKWRIGGEVGEYTGLVKVKHGALPLVGQSERRNRHLNSREG